MYRARETISLSCFEREREREGVAKVGVMVWADPPPPLPPVDPRPFAALPDLLPTFTRTLSSRLDTHRSPLGRLPPRPKTAHPLLDTLN
jgi:hypothetical protein